MKIGIYLGSFSPTEGGAYTFQESLLNKLAQYKQSSFQFVVFFYGRPIHQLNQLKWVAIRKPILQRVTRKLSGYFGRKYPSGLEQVIEEEKIDLVWFPSFSFESVEIPFIYTVWDLQHRLQPWFPEVSKDGQWESREKMYREALGRASFVLTGTNAGAQELTQFYGVPISRIRKLLHPVPDITATGGADIQDLVPPDWVGKYWFYPAQFWPHKNHIRILMALHSLKNDHNRNAMIVFCGSDKGNLSYLKDQARKLEIEEQVRFLGFVSHEQLTSLYKNAFALVFPTFFGPENLPPLEAFALGCPVIASNVEGAQEQLGDAALLFNPDNERSLVEQYLNLVNNTELRKQLIERGYTRARAYTTTHYLNDIFNIFREFESKRLTWAS